MDWKLEAPPCIAWPPSLSLPGIPATPVVETYAMVGHLNAHHDGACKRFSAPINHVASLSAPMLVGGGDVDAPAGIGGGRSPGRIIAGPALGNGAAAPGGARPAPKGGRISACPLPTGAGPLGPPWKPKGLCGIWPLGGPIGCCTGGPCWPGKDGPGGPGCPMAGCNAAGCPGGTCPLGPYCAVGNPDAGADPGKGLGCPMLLSAPLPSVGGRGKLDAVCTIQKWPMILQLSEHG